MDKKILAALILIIAVAAVAFAGCTGTDTPADKPAGENVTEKLFML